MATHSCFGFFHVWLSATTKFYLYVYLIYSSVVFFVCVCVCVVVYPLTMPLRLASHSSMVPSLHVGEFRYRTNMSAQCCFLQTYDTWLRITDFSVAEYAPSTSSAKGGDRRDGLGTDTHFNKQSVRQRPIIFGFYHQPTLLNFRKIVVNKTQQTWCWKNRISYSESIYI